MIYISAGSGQTRSSNYLNPDPGYYCDHLPGLIPVYNNLVYDRGFLSKYI